MRSTIEKLLKDSKAIVGLSLGYVLLALIAGLLTGKLYVVICLLNYGFVTLICNRYNYKSGSIFSPSAVFRIFTLHALVIAPILLDYFDYQIPFTYVSLVHEEYLLTWSLLYFLGLLITLAISWVNVKSRKFRKWRVDGSRFIFYWILLSLASLLLQVYVYYLFGGISGYIDIYASGESRDVFRGFGILFLFSESFPILFAMGVSYLMKTGRISKSLLVPFLLLYALLLIPFGGLRGSRSMFVFRLFMGAGIFHYSGIKISRTLLVTGALSTVLFISLYKSYYKNKSFSTGESISLSAAYQEQLVKFILITDLSRVDVQTLLIHQLERKDSEYELAMGRTYYSALFVMMPTAVYRAITGNAKPPSKTREGTNLVRGNRSYESGKKVSYVFGLLGESLLNFGLYGAVVVFVFFGVLFGFLMDSFRALEVDDSRRVLIPIVSILVVNLLQGDLDNNIFFVFKMGLMPYMLLRLSKSTSTDE